MHYLGNSCRTLSERQKDKRFGQLIILGWDFNKTQVHHTMTLIYKPNA